MPRRRINHDAKGGGPSPEGLMDTTAEQSMESKMEDLKAELSLLNDAELKTKLDSNLQESLKQAQELELRLKVGEPVPENSPLRQADKDRTMEAIVIRSILKERKNKEQGAYISGSKDKVSEEPEGQLEELPDNAIESFDDMASVEVEAEPSEEEAAEMKKAQRAEARRQAKEVNEARLRAKEVAETIQSDPISELESEIAALDDSMDEAEMRALRNQLEQEEVQAKTTKAPMSTEQKQASEMLKAARSGEAVSARKNPVPQKQGFFGRAWSGVKSFFSRKPRATVDTSKYQNTAYAKRGKQRLKRGYQNKQAGPAQKQNVDYTKLRPLPKGEYYRTQAEKDAGVTAQEASQLDKTGTE